MIVVFDLEQFSNFHSCFAIDINSEQEFYFEISDFQDDSVAYYKWLTQVKGMIGFNNLSYDYPLLEAFIKLYNNNIKGGELARALYPKGQEIIKNKWGIPEHKILIPQLDLFKIHHFDNKAKITSLKSLQVVMEWENVQDLPFKFDHHVSNDEREEIKKYNKNDVLSTYQFYLESKSVIDLRKKLTKTYNIPCRNWNDTKIGEQLILKMIAEKTNINKYKLSRLKTERNSIDLRKCLLPYNVKNKEIQYVIDNVLNKVIKETKGSINHRLLFEGMPYDFGTGGIHGCIGPGVYNSTDKIYIISSDVKSYYPNLSIQYCFYPEHLGKIYCDVYEDVYNLKTEAEKIGDSDQRAFAKLALNAAFGKSNDKFSFLYDPKYTLTTTINGQIMLTDLSLTLQKQGFKPLLANTDGIEFMVPKDKVDLYKEICQKWMDETNLILEHDQYESIAVRDVNC